MSWYNPFSWGGDDSDPVAEAQAQGVAAAKDYISKESTRLESEFQAKYNAAQSQFEATSSQLAKKETYLNEFSTSLTEKAAFTDDVIQKFNSSGQQASIAAANNGKPVKYSVATQPIEKPGPSPVIILGAVVMAYFVFFKKGR